MQDTEDYLEGHEHLMFHFLELPCRGLDTQGLPRGGLCPNRELVETVPVTSKLGRS